MPDEEKPVNTIADNKSPKTVAGLEQSVKDPDTKADTNAAATAAAAKEASDKEAAAKAAEFEKALAEKDNELSARQHKLIEKQLDKDGPDEPEYTPTDVAIKIAALVAGVPETTPDSHIIWGAAGVTITLGDFRVVAAAYNKQAGQDE